MKAQSKTRRFLIFSLMLHLSVAIALMYVTLEESQKNQTDFLEISFIEHTSPQTATPRVAQLELPAVQPMPKTSLQIEPKPMSLKMRSNVADSSKSSAPSLARLTTVNQPVSLRKANSPVATQANVQNETPALVHLAVETRGVNTSQLEEGLAFGAAGVGIGQGEGSGLGTGAKHGTFSSKTGNRGQGMGTSASGIASLVTSNGTASADDTLADVASSLVLGGEIPPLPKGEPGGIIVGRGRDIKGRLHLVKLDDPHDPGVDI